MPKYGINKAILVGNVGTEPELKHLEGGVAVCTFRLATTERIRGRDGSPIDRTDWHTIVFWRQRAEIAHKVLQVGTGIYVEGRIATRSWDGPDGQKRYRTEIEGEKMRLLDGTAHSAAAQPPAHEPAPEQQKPDAPEHASEGFEDDLPF